MRNRTEKIALLCAGAIILALLAGMFMPFGFETGENQPPQQLPDRMEADAPQETDERPPSATGDIDTP